MTGPAFALGALSDFVAIPSPSGEERAAADFVESLARSFGLDVERVGNSVLACARSATKGAAGPDLLFASHLDTVPAGEGWDADPFHGSWHEGRLVARGANDAKASAVAMLWAAARFRESKKAGSVWVAINEGEETTNVGMAAVLAALGTEPDAAVIGEPTGLAVVRAQAGLAVLEATWEGRSCHAAHAARLEVDNTLHRAASELADFGPWRELEDRHPLLGPTSIVPTTLHCGERHNVVPDRAVAVFDVRLTPPDDAALVIEELRRALPTARLHLRSDRLRPIETAADHPLVATALWLSGNEHAVGSNTLSDMALLQGVPAIKCGPGETSRSHTPNEYVTEGEVLAGCAFYAALMPALAERLAPSARQGART